MNKQDIEDFYANLARTRPNPQSELDFVNPFTLLVAVVLSAQATDVGVNRATRDLFQVADTPQKMMKLGEEKLKSHIKTIGLYNSKAKNIMGLSKKLVDEYDGQVPEDREALESLPGVGRKSANVVLNQAFGEPVMAVDTHIFRVANRTGLAPGKTPLEVEKKLMDVTPRQYLKDAHLWLVLHGRYICKARRPECWRCPVLEQCGYSDKNMDPKIKKAS